jgi:hypothetical protein
VVDRGAGASAGLTPLVWQRGSLPSVKVLYAKRPQSLTTNIGPQKISCGAASLVNLAKYTTKRLPKLDWIVPALNQAASSIAIILKSSVYS